MSPSPAPTSSLNLLTSHHLHTTHHTLHFLHRYVVATRDIAAGETVLRSRALAINIFDSYVKRVCGFCMRLSAKRLACACTACQYVFYCSPTCKSRHTEAHAIVCPYWAAFPPSKAVSGRKSY